jgi:hypothetical protein
MSEPRPTTGPEIAQALAAASGKPYVPQAVEAHNAVTAVVGMYGSIVAQQWREIELLRAELASLRVRLAARESGDDRKDVKGPPGKE